MREDIGGPWDHAFEIHGLVTTACPADLDESGDVGFRDLLAILAAWGPCACACPEDLDRDGIVDFADLVALLAAWGPCTP